MEAARLGLPQTIIGHIHNFASDKRDTHPVAQCIKEVDFEYKAEENKYGWGMYKPNRLQVSCKRFIGTSQLEFNLTDFLPSYWSVHESSKFDNRVYDEEYMNNWLADSDWLQL